MWYQWMPYRSYNNLGSFKNHVSFVHNTTNECFLENSLEADQHITHDTSAEPNSGDDSSTSGDEDVTGDEDVSGYHRHSTF